MDFIKKYQKIIATAINKHPLEGFPKELYEPMNYILGIGGKRLRPILVLMIHDLFKEVPEQAVKAALGIEFFHNFSLMHDDIMDAAPLRRNYPTVHKKYGINTAILSGDAMLVKSFQMLEDLEPNLFKDCFKLLSNTALRVCEGQQSDMEFENQSVIELDQYLEMIKGKTAELCACSLKMGAMLAKTTQENIENAYQFGLYLGLAFQLMDDYLDVFGQKDLVGKKLAGDIYENKKTILYILAMQKANNQQQKELEYWFTKKDKNAEEVEKIIRLFNNLGVAASTLRLVEEYTEKAKEYLINIKSNTDNKKPLFDLMSYLLIRQH